MGTLLDLTDRVAVVIGGTSGIGQAMALGLAEHGAHVIPTGRRAEKVESTCQQIEDLGRRTLRRTADVRSRESIDAFRDAVDEGFGRIDILLNAAGYSIRTPTAVLPEDQWSCIVDTNLTGALRVCQSFYSHLKQSGHGRVINIISLGSFLAFHEVAAYCAAKSGLLSLTRSLGVEWARDGIWVNAIAPGVFPTDLNRELVEGTPRGREILMRTPMGRYGEVKELVGAAVLLASDGASFLTGQCISVDGGYLASGVNT